MDCASTIFGIIRHHKHNFHLFSKKSTASIIYSFGLFTKLSFIDRVTNVFGRTSVLQAHLSNKINFFSAHSWDLGPKGSDTGLFPRMRITILVTQDGVQLLVVNCLSFYGCQTINNK